MVNGYEIIKKSYIKVPQVERFIIEDLVVIGCQVGIVGCSKIRKGCCISGQSVLIDSLAQGSIVAGFPSLPIKKACRIKVVSKKIHELIEK